MDTTQLKRIADALEEILKMVKQEQEEAKKHQKKPSSRPPAFSPRKR